MLFQKKESSEVIGQLLDVTSTPRRPQYVMAADFPLNLFHCQYGEDEIEWQYEEEAIAFLTRQFQALWAEHQARNSPFAMILLSVSGSTYSSLSLSLSAPDQGKHAQGFAGRSRCRGALLRHHQVPAGRPAAKVKGEDVRSTDQHADLPKLGGEDGKATSR